MYAQQSELLRELRNRISKIPRTALGEFPTPLTELNRLQRTLGGPRLFMKREDLSGLALGGNKTRLLEFRLAEALSENADVIVAGLEVQSNSARQLAAAANRLGMRTVLILRPEGEAHWQGNLLLDQILGADILFLPSADADIDDAMRTVAERERQAGHRPYVMNHAHLFGIGASLAGLEWTLEVIEQLDRLALAPTHFYLSSGGKCQSGMVLAQQALGSPFRVIGIHARPEPTGPASTAAIANATAEALGLELRVTPQQVENHSEFAGSAFGISTAEGNAAVEQVARLEGIFLDPVFTGKAMAGLLHDIQRGALTKADVVVFVHTGGIPALFAHATEFSHHAGRVMS